MKAKNLKRVVRRWQTKSMKKLSEESQQMQVNLENLIDSNASQIENLRQRQTLKAAEILRVQGT